MGQGKLVFVGMIIARPKYKLARRAQAQRCNDRLGAQLPFVITVPAHAIAAVTVQVKKNSIEGRAGEFFDAVSYID